MKNTLTESSYYFDWTALAFGSKKPLKDLEAVFIAAPRQLTDKRFKQIVKEYLPKGNIVLGIAKEPYVEGFDGQPQFRMLQQSAVSKIINQVNETSSSRHIYVLEYFQRELPYILEKIPFKQALFVNGSWKHVFHVSPSYYILAATKTPYELLSAFSDELEARNYEAKTDQEINNLLNSNDLFRGHGSTYTEAELVRMAEIAAKRSYDHSYQTGLTLAKPTRGSVYKALMNAFNGVVPFQTYAMLYGAAREKYFSPPNDLNRYDTIHAEVHLLIQALKEKDNPLQGATLFINLMPCPACARMLAETDIEEIVYSLDHSEGYALRMLEKAGKKVRRIVPPAHT